MASKFGPWFLVPVFLAVFLAVVPSRAEDVILLDDDAPQPAVSSSNGPTPTATPKAAPAQKAAPTPSPTPAPSLVPTPVPSKSPTQSPLAVTPSPTQAPAPEEKNLSESARFAKRLGVLRHPVLWLALDASYAYALTAGLPSISSGFGLDGRVELQFFSWMSIGAYYNFSLFPDSQGLLLTGPLGMMGRIIPFTPEKPGDPVPYLMGGAGLNSLVGQNLPQYPGHFAAFAGVGALCPFGDKWAADLGLAYDFYSPHSAALQTLGLRVGLAYSFQE